MNRTVSHDEWMMSGVRLDGTKVVNKRMTHPQAHFHLEVLDVSPAIGPKRLEWVKMNVETGAAVTPIAKVCGEGSIYVFLWILKHMGKGCAAHASHGKATKPQNDECRENQNDH